LLQEAKKISELSDGAALDITVAPIVNAWGICSDDPRIPSANEINDLLPFINYNDVLIDEENSTVMLQREGQKIDLGGIAKGYIGDLAIDIYKEYGITSAFINLGGNVVVLGNKPDGSSWKVGVQDPRGDTSDIIGYVEVCDQAVVTSGDYQRYFIEDGKRYCHIIDPTTGYPIDNDLMSVTVITSSSADADGLAKAIVLGLDDGMAFIEAYDGAEAIFITTDKEIYVTEGLNDTFHFEDTKNEYTYVQNR
jgi:thiamine biosynthesis lipoprotein